MKFQNIFLFNNWKFDKFIKIILTFQIVFWCLIGLEQINISIPLIKIIISLIIITTSPGFLILRILKIHNLDIIENIVYVVGLSISTTFFIGLFVNFIIPLFGIKAPFSELYLTISLTIFILILSLISFIRDRGYAKQEYLKINILKPHFLYLIFIPFIAILGTYYMNHYNENIILIFLIIFLASIPVLVSYDKMDKNLYPFAIFIISISLLYHKSLISNYLYGWDIHLEYFFSNLVLNNSFWNFSIYHSYNSMLSVVLLAPIMSSLSKINLIWIYKIVYPLLYSIVPLILFKIIRKQINDKISFLSVFFFMSFSAFFEEMIHLARQQIAEIFFVLLILLMLNKELENYKKSIFFVIFAFSLIVSHYGLSYVFLIMLVGYIFVIYVLYGELLKKLFKLERIKKVTLKSSISFNMILLFLIFSLSWYMYLSGSHPFEVFIKIGNHILNTINSDFLNPQSSQGLSLLMADVKYPILGQINRIISYLNQMLIIIGICIALKVKKYNFNEDYKILSILALIILFATVFIPFFARTLNISRFYHIAIVFLSPFLVVGGIESLKFMFNKLKFKKIEKKTIRIFSVYLIIFFLFQTGWMYEVFEGTSNSISFNSKIDSPKFTPSEIFGASWISNEKNEQSVYGDELRYLLLSGYEGITVKKLGVYEIKPNSLIYLGNKNILNNNSFLVNIKNKVSYLDYVNFYNLTPISRFNVIYANGGSKVYYL
jgi:uncharacterized membrane protein